MLFNGFHYTSGNVVLALQSLVCPSKALVVALFSFDQAIVDFISILLCRSDALRENDVSVLEDDRRYAIFVTAISLIKNRLKNPRQQQDFGERQSEIDKEEDSTGKAFGSNGSLVPHRHGHVRNVCVSKWQHTGLCSNPRKRYDLSPSQSCRPCWHNITYSLFIIPLASK